MPPFDLDNIHKWRAADRAAAEAERNVFRASMAFLEGNGPAPDDRQWEEAKALREEAKRLFAIAMEEVSVINTKASLGAKAPQDRPLAASPPASNDANGRSDSGQEAR